MSDPQKKEQSEEKSQAQNLVEKILPQGSVADIKNVLGETTVDLTLDDLPAQSTVSTAPTASAIPKRPIEVVNTPQSNGLRTSDNISAPAGPETVPLNTNGTFPAESPYSKPPIFGSRIGRLVSILIGLGLFFGMIGAIIYFLTSGRGFVLPDFFENETVVPMNTNGVTNQVIVNTANTSPVLNENSSAVPPQPTDTDGDGLLDAEEERIATDPKKIDTDGDGLTDRQEIEIYKTAPLKKDTDADGFSDGSEVRNFYNPNGDGQLLNVSEAIDSISNSNTTTQ